MNPQRSPEQCAQEQLDAYNSRSIDAFAQVYDESVQLIDLSTGEAFCTGRNQLIERYGKMFAERTELHCVLTSRIICNPFVYDEEHVTGLVPDKIVHAVATYEVRDGYIIKAWFAKETI